MTELSRSHQGIEKKAFSAPTLTVSGIRGKAVEAPLKQDYIQQESIASLKVENTSLKGENTRLKGIIAERRELMGKVIEQVRNTYIDVLTGIPNGRAFQKALARTVERAQRGRSFVLIMADANGLKEVNDSAGRHEAGDEFLKKLATLLKSSMRKVDSVFRLHEGGDEFAVILDGANDKTVTKWWRRFKEKTDEEGVSVSAGAIELDQSNFEQAERIADAFSYISKAVSKGKNPRKDKEYKEYVDFLSSLGIKFAIHASKNVRQADQQSTRRQNVLTVRKKG